MAPNTWYTVSHVPIVRVLGSGTCLSVAAHKADTEGNGEAGLCPKQPQVQRQADYAPLLDFYLLGLRIPCPTGRRQHLPGVGPGHLQGTNQ